jgi:hypothetical protein
VTSPGERDGIRTIAIVVAAALVVALVRGPLFEATRHVRETSDVYDLPPPEDVVVLSLGYRSAVADLLWARVLVSQGLRTQEKRRFDNLTLLLDAINTLDPTFREPYRLADALITFQPGVGRADAIKARQIMERGLAARPLDGELWLDAGEFIAFIAPASGWLADADEVARWRLDGAHMLARAADLGGNQSFITAQALGGAGLLSKAGERDAAIRFYRRTLAVTDDPELKDKIQALLDHLVGEKNAQARQDLFHRLEQGILDAWHHDVPYVARRRLMILGPPRDPAYCAGDAHRLEPACAGSWQEWEDRIVAAEGFDAR